jgi:hypothetical protein
MPIGSRLQHTVAVVRRGESGVFDDYNQPVFDETVLATLAAAIMPKDEREQLLASQVGAGLSDHTIFTLPTDLTGADYIVHDQGDCPMTEDLPHMRFEIAGIRNAAGLGHHLEIDARAVQGVQDVTGS